MHVPEEQPLFMPTCLRKGGRASLTPFTCRRASIFTQRCHAKLHRGHPLRTLPEALLFGRADLGSSRLKQGRRGLLLSRRRGGCWQWRRIGIAAKHRLHRHELRRCRDQQPPRQRANIGGRNRRCADFRGGSFGLPEQQAGKACPRPGLHLLPRRAAAHAVAAPRDAGDELADHGEAADLHGHAGFWGHEQLGHLRNHQRHASKLPLQINCNSQHG
mmetsp:Transcript_91577/g.262316  ORF Transcript_91577/g.262316 Transcript_91577/m.262316 type:complete len:216 (-) Transcript_91577:23-670(-)